MPILPELYPEAPRSPALLGAALRRSSQWWSRLLAGLVAFTTAG